MVIRDVDCQGFLKLVSKLLALLSRIVNLSDHKRMGCIAVSTVVPVGIEHTCYKSACQVMVPVAGMRVSPLNLVELFEMEVCVCHI